MSDPVTDLKRELLAAAERQQWHAALGSAGVARKSRRRWLKLSHVQQGGRRRRLVVLAVAALVVLGATSAFAVRAFVIDKGIVGLPPVGATPSTPERGVLEMYYWLHGVQGGGKNWVYADGRLIRLGASRRGFLERRLTREGVKLLRSEIVSAGGFGHAQPPPGSESLPGGWPPIQVRKGDRLVPLRWASDLKRLEARLTHPESWLPASAWKQRKIRAYVPSRFAVCATAVVNVNDPPHFKVQQMRSARIVALLPEAAQNVLRGRDWNARGAGPGCFAVTTNEARSLAKALDGAGPATAKKGGAINLNYRFDAPGPSRQVWIGFDPFLPHGEVTCSACG
jgi:hypothetical protein